MRCVTFWDGPVREVDGECRLWLRVSGEWYEFRKQKSTKWSRGQPRQVSRWEQSYAVEQVPYLYSTVRSCGRRLGWIDLWRARRQLAGFQ